MLYKVYNDLLFSVESGNCGILILVDLSATVDTVNHDILIDFLRHGAGLDDTALNWFASNPKNIFSQCRQFYLVECHKVLS